MSPIEEERLDCRGFIEDTITYLNDVDVLFALWWRTLPKKWYSMRELLGMWPVDVHKRTIQRRLENLRKAGIIREKRDPILYYKINDDD